MPKKKKAETELAKIAAIPAIEPFVPSTSVAQATREDDEEEKTFAAAGALKDLLKNFMVSKMFPGENPDNFGFMQGELTMRYQVLFNNDSQPKKLFDMFEAEEHKVIASAFMRMLREHTQSAEVLSQLLLVICMHELETERQRMVKSDTDKIELPTVAESKERVVKRLVALLKTMGPGTVKSELLSQELL